MPTDVFDEIETPKGDIFDEIEAPSDSISGSALGTEMTAQTSEPPVMEETDPMFPAAQQATTIARIGLENFLLPTRVDAFDMLDQQQRARGVADAEVAAQKAEERLGPLKANPRLLASPEASALATAANRLRERANALNERYQASTPLGQMRAEEAATAQRESDRRKAFEASGEGPGVVGTFLEQVAGMATNTLGGFARTFAPSIGAAPGDALIRAGGEMTELANVNQSLGGKVARGAGTVAGLLAANPAGVIPATATVGLKGAMDAYAQTLSATGNASEANRAAASTFPALALYMATGIAGARGAASLVAADATAAQKALAGFAGAGLANVGTTAVMAAAEGQGYGIEQLTADTLLALFHAKGEYGRAEAEAREAAKVELENRGFTEEQLAKPYEAEGPTPATVVELPPDRAPIQAIADEVSPPPQQQRTPTVPDGEPSAAASEMRPPAEGAADAPVTAPMGPGAASIQEIAAPKEIGAYNAKVDEQRAARGLLPLMSEARRGNEATWDAAQARIESNAELPRIITDELLDGTRKAVNAEDQGVLAWRMVDLTNKRDLEAQRINDPNVDPVAQAEAEAAFNHFESELQRTEEANRKFGTEWGRTGQFRQRLIRDDFTLGNMEARARVAKGQPLTPDEVTQIRQQNEQIQKAEEAYEARVEKVEAAQPVDAAIRQIEAASEPDFAPEVRSLADRLVQRLDRAADAALRRLRAKGMAQLGSSPDPTIIADAVIYGTAKITKGLVKSGQWAASMVKDLGEWVRPHLQDIWRKANEEIEGQVTRATSPRNRASVKDAVTKAATVATADQVGAEIGARVKAGEALKDLRGPINKLVETLVRGGVKQRDPLVDAVHAVLQTVDPAITRRQAMDAISGYGDFKPLNADVVKAEVRDLKGQLQQVAKMEDLLAGDPLKKTGVERRPPSDEERRLIKQVNELAKEKGVKVTDPAVQLRTIVGAIETRLTNRIKDLKAEIMKGERLIKERKAPPTSAKIEALRAELSEVEAQHEAVFGKRGMTDEQRLKTFKTRTDKRIRELEDRMAKGDFAQRHKKPPVDISKDPEAVRLKAKADAAKKEFESKRFQWEQAKRSAGRKFIDNAVELFGASRSLMTSFDISAPFRQGGFVALGDLVTNPRRFVRQFRKMLGSLRSEGNLERSQAEISLRPNAELYKKSGLHLADLGEKMTAREESMMSKLAEKVPGVRASNRAYMTFLNKQRADLMDAYVEAMGGKDVVTAEQAQFLADGINDFTGRGFTPKSWAGAMNTFAKFLFSPRNLLSRFNVLTLRPIFRGVIGGPKVGAKARALMALQYGKFVGGLAAFYGMAKLAGMMTDEDVKIETDPRSSDFGKVRMGKTRIDPMAGMQQVAVLAARTISGRLKPKKGGSAPITGQVYGNFLRSKMAPIPGGLLDLRLGKNVVGEKVGVGDFSTGLLLPLSASSDVVEVYREHGPVKGTVIELLNLMGMGMQNYR